MGGVFGKHKKKDQERSGSAPARLEGLNSDQATTDSDTPGDTRVPQAAPTGRIGNNEPRPTSAQTFTANAGDNILPMRTIQSRLMAQQVVYIVVANCEIGV